MSGSTRAGSRWVARPWSVAVTRAARPTGTDPGSSLTLDLPGAPTLKVVGIVDSITGTADAWVWPDQADVLHAAGATASRQMLYRFGAAPADAAVRARRSIATGPPPRGPLL